MLSLHPSRLLVDYFSSHHALTCEFDHGRSFSHSNECEAALQAQSHGRAVTVTVTVTEELDRLFQIFGF
jgi:hypothetical protein